MMPKAKNGDTVKVHYTGKFDDGSIFDTSADGDPLQFTIGEGGVIPGFEKAVIGMELSENKSVKIASDDAYGPYNNDLSLEVKKEDLPDDSELELGMEFEFDDQDGESIMVTVIEIKDDEVVLDANHPLAGQDLNFDLELVEIL